MNEQIDNAVLERMKSLNSTGIKAECYRLTHAIQGLELPKPNKPQPAHWWLAELVNRSCQRLRKRGIVKFHSRNGWFAQENTKQP